MNGKDVLAQEAVVSYTGLERRCAKVLFDLKMQSCEERLGGRVVF